MGGGDSVQVFGGPRAVRPDDGELDPGYRAGDLFERGNEHGKPPACEQGADVQHQRCAGRGRRRERSRRLRAGGRCDAVVDHPHPRRRRAQVSEDLLSREFRYGDDGPRGGRRARRQPSPAQSLTPPEPLGVCGEGDVVQRNDRGDVERERHRVAGTEEDVEPVARRPPRQCPLFPPGAAGAGYRRAGKACSGPGPVEGRRSRRKGARRIDDQLVSRMGRRAGPLGAQVGEIAADAGAPAEQFPAVDADSHAAVPARRARPSIALR